MANVVKVSTGLTGLNVAKHPHKSSVSFIKILQAVGAQFKNTETEKKTTGKEKEKKTKSSALQNQSDAVASLERHSDKTKATGDKSLKTVSGHSTKGCGKSLRDKQMPSFRTKRKAENSTVVPPEQLSFADPAAPFDTIPVGIRGNEAVPVHCVLYDKIIRLVQEMPADAKYRQYTEQTVQSKLQYVKTEPDVLKLEEKLNCGQIEEVITQARNELSLARKMSNWKAWEPLVEEPPAGQWKWPL